MKINQLKENPGLLLIVGAMLVGIPRWVDAFTFEAHSQVVGGLWTTAHSLSGLGMVIIEALSIWFVSAMLSRHGKRNVSSAVLLALIVCMFLSIPAILIPTIAATSNGLSLGELLGRAGIVAWSFPMALAPMFVIAASAIAEHLAKSATQPAGNIAQHDAEIKANMQMLAQMVNRVDDMVCKLEATPAQPAIPAMPEPLQIAQPTQPDHKMTTLKEAMEALPGGTHAQWAEMLGKTRQAVDAELRKQKQNGHAEVAR